MDDQSPKTQAPQGANVFNRHWRGEYSLPISYWVVGVAGNLAFLVLIAVVVFVVRLEDFNPYLAMAALTTVWGAGLACQIFQSVGVWRSAIRYRRQKRSQGKLGLWGIAAQTAIVLGALGLVNQLVRTGAPQLGEAWRMAFLGDPGIPDYSLRLMRGGTEAELAGGFKYGLGRDAEKLFAGAPGLKLVHLNSGGGRLGEAQKLARLIRERGLSTYTSSSCSSACTVAFLAGRERWLKQGAQLGFHRENFAGVESSDNMRRLLTEAGLDARFVDRAVATAAVGMWYPTVPELIAARVISGTVDSYRFAASGFGTRLEAATFEKELRRTPLFAAIEASEPQAFAGIVDSVHRSYVEGVPEGRIMDDMRGTRVAPLILAHMAYADDQLLADYAALMADQYEALGRRDAGACFQYAAKGATTTLVHLLPADLKQREMALSEAVMRSTVRRKPATDASVQAAYRAIFDNLTREFGQAQVRLLADPGKVAAVQYAAYCSLAVAMFRAVSTLPPDQAGDVMSQIFRSIAQEGLRK